MIGHDDTEEFTQADADRAEADMLADIDDDIREMEQEELDRENDGDNPNP